MGYCAIHNQSYSESNGGFCIYCGKPELKLDPLSAIAEKSSDKVLIPKPEKIKKPINKPRCILWKHSRAPGDLLMLSAGVRDFHFLFPHIRQNVKVKFPELFLNNPYIDSTITEDTPGVCIYEVGYPQIQGCNDGYMHFSMCFLFDMITHAGAYYELGNGEWEHENLNMGLSEFCSVFSGGGAKQWGVGEIAREPFITWRKKYGKFNSEGFARQHGDLHLTNEEKKNNPIKDLYGIDHYWVVAPGGKRDCTAKIYDYRRFQKVVDHFDGMIKFVVIGRSDHLIEKLDNVISWVDKSPNLRDLFPLVYHAEGCVSNISFLMHLAAAIPPKNEDKRIRPCVAIYGGREPPCFTWYPGHQILHTMGMLPCAKNGGCWQSRVVPIAKDPENNSRMCHKTTVDDGRTIQECMDMITADDIIRSIEKYYEGGLYHYSKEKIEITNMKLSNKDKNELKIPGKLQFHINTSDSSSVSIKDIEFKKEINFIASLQSRGGGEQSACKIVELLRSAGWKVNFYPWAKKHEKFNNVETEKYSFHTDNEKLKNEMPSGLPLLFYGNDQVNDFCKEELTGWLVEKSSKIIIGINYVNSKLPRCTWISKTGKVKAVICQNKEKLDEFKRDMIGFQDTKMISLFGAIDLDTFYELEQRRRAKDEDMVILKHCGPDWRKYVTEKSEGTGEKIHQWQKDFAKDRDTKFYSKLLKDLPKTTKFVFMEAHPELIKHFAGEERMKFYQWDSMPVPEFLRHGHVYLYRTSNAWRDQYPRCVAEALAAGLPVITEPRDGTKDRVIHGDTGIHCFDYDMFLDAIKKYHRKENYRFNSGKNAKEWARKNLDPKEWVRVINGVINGNT